MGGNWRWKGVMMSVSAIIKVIETEPGELGYEFGRWTGARLATYLAEQTGKELSSSQVRRILKEKKEDPT
jgi:transposase